MPRRSSSAYANWDSPTPIGMTRRHRPSTGALHCSGVLYYIYNIIFISYNVPFNFILIHFAFNRRWSCVFNPGYLVPCFPVPRFQRPRSIKPRRQLRRLSLGEQQRCHNYHSVTKPVSHGFSYHGWLQLFNNSSVTNRTAEHCQTTNIGLDHTCVSYAAKLDLKFIFTIFSPRPRHHVAVSNIRPARCTHVQ